MIEPTLKFVDAHCHLDLYPDMEEVMRRCGRDRIATVAVTTTPRAWPRNRDLAREHPCVEAALGLHPQLAGQFHAEIGLWESYLSEARFVGEVGLDASPKFFKSFDIQKVVFSQVLRCCASQGGKILTVHSVRSAKAVLDLIEEHLTGSDCRVILHWFTGSALESRRAVDLGCYFSVNIEVLRKPAHVSTLKSIPIERLLTETDGPFTQSRSAPSTPSDVKSTVAALADALGLRTEDLRETILNNYLGLVSRSGQEASL